MRRRDFVKGLTGLAVGWPLAALAQQPMPVVGFLNFASAKDYMRPLSAFLKGLSEAGYVSGQSVQIEYRWADGQIDRLSAMAADLAKRQVTAIAATSTPAALAAKAATSTIPIVFETGADPIKIWLVTNFSRPTGNITGITQQTQATAPKMLEALHELLPSAHLIGLLVNPADPALAETTGGEMMAAAHLLGLDGQILAAASERDFDGVFAKLAEMRAGALVITPDGLFTSQSEHLAALSMRYRMPTIYKGRDFAAAGGLMSYGADTNETYHLAGGYIGRILKGDKPADLPVQQAIKVEMFINMKTAKALGITVPLPLSGRADDIIE